MNLIQKLEQEEIKRLGKTIPDFVPGDTVVVNVNVVEGERKRVQAFEGVVIARSYSLLEYNVPRAKLREAEKITPGFNSPTVSALEDADWCAVRVMVRRTEVIEIMEKLESLGASAILETEITNCRL